MKEDLTDRQILKGLFLLAMCIGGRSETSFVRDMIADANKLTDEVLKEEKDDAPVPPGA